MTPIRKYATIVLTAGLSIAINPNVIVQADVYALVQVANVSVDRRNKKMTQTKKIEIEYSTWNLEAMELQGELNAMNGYVPEWHNPFSVQED